MALKWNFQRGWGIQAKKSSVGGVWIFSGTTHLIPSSGSRKYPYSHHRGNRKFQKGGRVKTQEILEGKVLGQSI